GLDASAITTGIIDQDRLPVGNGAGFIAYFHVPTTTSNTWTDMPSAETELLATSSKRQQLDTLSVTQLRLNFRVQGAGSTNAKCYARYTLDDGTNWVTITGGDVSLATPSGSKAGAYVSIPGA